MPTLWGLIILPGPLSDPPTPQHPLFLKAGTSKLRFGTIPLQWKQGGTGRAGQPLHGPAQLLRVLLPQGCEQANTKSYKGSTESAASSHTRTKPPRHCT